MEPNNYPYFPPHYTESSNNNDMHSLQTISQEKEKRNSLLLITEPKDLDKLFDTARSLERDICFPPNSNGRPSTSSTMHDARIEDEIKIHDKITSRHSNSSSSSSFDGVDLSALSLFSTIHSPIHSPQPKHYYGNEKNKKLFSLYGDNSRDTVNHNNSKQFPMLQQRQDDRFIYYHLDTGCIKGKSLSELKLPHLTLEDLLLKENYWIDITCPSNEEMKAISKVFHIHPLTTEDIMSHEIREKCDVFRHYMFVCYRAFVHDNHQLRPVTFYNIVTKRHILTFHFDHVPHVRHVQQRVNQLQDYIEVVPDWINYAIMDEITDSFAPMIQQIESEVDSIDDLVLLYKSDQSDMVLRIGTCRKKVIQMVRLLGTKVEVVRGLMKRIEERSIEQELSNDPNISKIYPDVGLYLGDVQDHILTMLQNLNHYETVLARSESNYLARISIELTQTSNSTNHVIGRLTIFATVLLPMNLVTGLWGMNVKVPGKDYDNLIYFFWIVLSLAVFAILSLTFAKRLKLI
ncbi:hypothetical protein INT48_005016 [Thamnidium elegans]|uniref:Cora-domain-containing protein n=1 Tax=Thamnidium elegans TaxID=101142 RepID=A0A8H7SRM0_9FUNG|nr:hypothetical protein INT48_005016 [Thamnidium elegans]